MISKELCVVLQMPPVEEVKTSEYLRQLTAQDAQQRVLGGGRELQLPHSSRAHGPQHSGCG